jgi:lipoprotein-releasing system permease protein
MYEYDSAYVFMPLEAAQLYFMLPQQASQIEISVVDPDRTGAAAAAILARTGNGYRLTDWKEANASFFGAIQVEGNVMFLILTLIIIVAAFNIISSQIMLVKEKAAPSLHPAHHGCHPRHDPSVFLISGASIGVVGRSRSFRGTRLRRQYRVHPAGAAEPAHDAVPAGLFLSQLPAIVDPERWRRW